VKKSQENTNQIFLYLNRGLQDYINQSLLSGEHSSNVKKDMEEICYNIVVKYK